MNYKIEQAKYNFLNYKNPTIDQQIALDRLCFLTIWGSYAYGTNIEESDIDLTGFFIAPKINLYNILDKWEYTTFKRDKENDTIMEFRQFCHLCSEAKPYHLETLFMPDEYILYENWIGKKMRDNKDLFLSKLIYDSFVGRAKSILMLMAESKKIDYKIISRKIRLLLQCKRIFKNNTINCFLDKDEIDLILNIRKEKIKYDEIVKISKQLIEEINELKEKSILPDLPDIDKIYHLQIEIIDQALEMDLQCILE